MPPKTEMTTADPVLASRVEDAGLNASAPPGQRWIDGWLVRTLPGKARRARCVNALADGVMALDDRLALAEAACRAGGVPLIFRVTPYTRPAGLPAALQARGFVAVDETVVMIAPQLPAGEAPALPEAFVVQALDGAGFAAAVGALRGTPEAQVQTHALRLAHSPVPYFGLVVRRAGDEQVLACGQVAVDGELAGLYDVVTRADARNQGLASALCRQLLALATSRGARTGYLQVDAQNPPALAIYHRLGFAEAYRYHYLERPAG